MTLNFLAFHAIPSTFTSNDVKQIDEMTMLPYSGAHLSTTQTFLFFLLFRVAAPPRPNLWRSRARRSARGIPGQRGQRPGHRYQYAGELSSAPAALGELCPGRRERTPPRRTAAKLLPSRDRSCSLTRPLSAVLEGGRARRRRGCRSLAYTAAAHDVVV